MIVIKRNYLDYTKEILKDMNIYFYCFDVVEIGIIANNSVLVQFKSNKNKHKYNINNVVLMEIIHALNECGKGLKFIN